VDYAVIISAIVLGLSILATAAKFLDWFLHSDPKTMLRTMRWMVVLLVIVAIPLLTIMIAREQWAGAMLLGAGSLAVSLFLKWRDVLAPLRAAVAHFRPKPRPFEVPPVWQDDVAAEPSAVHRAVAILEAYVRQTAPSASRDRDGTEMAVKEALEVLGLPDGADVAAVHTAHRRLMRMVDPDIGGSPYLAARIDQARDVLIDVLRRRLGPTAIEMSAPKRLPTR
jgi:hypothetical protein